MAILSTLVALPHFPLFGELLFFKGNAHLNMMVSADCTFRQLRYQCSVVDMLYQSCKSRRTPSTNSFHTHLSRDIYHTGSLLLAVLIGFACLYHVTFICTGLCYWLSAIIPRAFAARSSLLLLAACNNCCCDCIPTWKRHQQ